VDVRPHCEATFVAKTTEPLKLANFRVVPSTETASKSKKDIIEFACTAIMANDERAMDRLGTNLRIDEMMRCQQNKKS